jgi:hypothetical protein
MVNLKINVEKLSLSILFLFVLCIPSGCYAKINTKEKSTNTFVLQNNTLRKKADIKEMNIVVVRKNELLLISLNKKDENIILDNNGIFSRPLISTNRENVSYLKNNVLYITTNKIQHIKVADNVSQLSFSWQNEHSLLYSTISGGLYIYDVINKINKPYIQNEFNYQNITLDNDGGIYAEKYKYFKKNGTDYINDYGVIYFDPVTKDEKIVIKSIPSKINTGGDLGMYPIITGISKDNKYLYIWKHPHAGSLAADGVNLAIFDIFNNRLIEYTNPNMISLAYSDNLSPNPINSRYLALIYGAGREMGNNKNLVILDILNGKFQYLCPKGKVSMTPFFTNDGKTILFACSDEQKSITGGLTQWLLNGKHHIYSIDTTSNKIKQLTNSLHYFDFSPHFIDNKKIIFFRSDKDENVSIWEYENGKEEMLADGLIFYTDFSYSSQSSFGHFNTSQFTDIK